MRDSGLASLLIAGLVAAACTIERADVRTPSGEPPEADTAKVRRVVDAIAVAFERGDVASLDTLYHDRVLIFENGTVAPDWPGYRDQHLVPALDALTDLRVAFEEVDIRPAGSTAWATFRYRMEWDREGDPVSADGVGTIVLRRTGGRWRVTHIHNSSPRPQD